MLKPFSFHISLRRDCCHLYWLYTSSAIFQSCKFKSPLKTTLSSDRCHWEQAPGKSVSSDQPNYSPPPVGERCIAIGLYVYVSVCPRAYLWNRWTDRHEILCADLLWPWPWLGPPPAALRYVMYTSGFMDDVTVTFGHYGPYGVAWPAWAASISHRLRARPRHSLM